MTFVVRAICSLILTAILAVGTASAQTWPSRTITAIIPFAPGNANDITARIVLDYMSKQLGQVEFQRSQ